LFLSLCDYSPHPVGPDDDAAAWDWWDQHRDQQVRACRQAAIASEQRLLAQGIEPYHGPEWGLPAAARIFDGMTTEAAERGPAPVIEFEKKPEDP
jgi:hypothetical protein